jgi:hypothetical protein
VVFLVLRIGAMRFYPFTLLFLKLAAAFPHLMPGLKPDPKATRSWFRRRQELQDGPESTAEYRKIDVSGSHAWQAPGPNDKYLAVASRCMFSIPPADRLDRRGPCPALNSLANHGYLPHNGIVGLMSAATVTNEIFGRSYTLERERGARP